MAPRPRAQQDTSNLQAMLLLSRFSRVRLNVSVCTRLPRPWDSPGKNTGVGCHFLLQCMKVKSESEVTQSCPTLSDPMDCSLPGSSIHGIFQAQVLEWVAIAFSAAGYGHKQFPSAPPAPAQHKPETFISLKHSNMESFLHWCRIVPPDSWATMERILRYFETQNRKRTVIACSGSLHAKSKDPVVQVSWNK